MAWLRLHTKKYIQEPTSKNYYTAIIKWGYLKLRYNMVPSGQPLKIWCTPNGQLFFSVLLDDIKISNIHLAPGGVHSMVITNNTNEIYELNDFLLTQENSIHMLWLFPQYFVITAAEIMISITGLEFSYSQVG